MTSDSLPTQGALAGAVRAVGVIGTAGASLIVLAALALAVPSCASAAPAGSRSSAPSPTTSTSTSTSNSASASASASAASQPPSTSGSAYRELTWIQLVPPGWDPMKRFRDVGIGRLSDNSPRTAALMADLRDELDNAPLVETLQDAPVRLPGYVVPLQADRDGVREFLLVPYFGACIHMPPPPANQIILVKLASPAKQLRAMDTVWASGVMRLDRQPSDMGVSGYRLDAASVEPYRNKPR